MKRPPRPTVRWRTVAPLVAWTAASLLGACAGGPGRAAPAPAASEAEWRTLATPRPTPLPDAVRLSVADIELLGEPAIPSIGSMSARLGMTELVAAGLLRRADVRFVERRRFSAAVEAERSGGARSGGAPPAGVSPGAELTATVTWVPLGTGEASLEVRLTESATGRVARTLRVLVPGDAEPVGLARVSVGAILGALDELGRLPAWNDPIEATAPAEYVPSGVPSGALDDFLAGLAAEERWRWESARVAYQSAARAPGFFEAEAALSRTARLRLGGTLGEG
jgi:hypothetical protein